MSTNQQELSFSHAASPVAPALAPPSASGAGMVTVSAGIYSRSFPVANLTVAEIRRRLGTLLDIPADGTGTVLLDGNVAGPQSVVPAGALLLFVRQSGSKGAGH